MSDRPTILQERQKTHGSFMMNAMISQALKAEFKRAHPGYDNLGPVHKEALDMIALKLSRILSGQAMFDDHWKDIAGYAQLAEETCHD